MNEQALCRALKGSLSGIGFDPVRQRAVLARIRERRPVRRSLALVVALAVMLLAGTAVAAGLGLFGRFAQRQDESVSTVQLGRLESLAVSYDEARTLAVGGKKVTLTLRQAYCDGIRLYYTYEIHSATVGDGAYLADGTPTQLLESGEIEQENGVIAGFQTVELPEGVDIDDMLEFLLPVGDQRVSFTIRVSGIRGTLTGQGAFGAYAAGARLRQTDIVLQGSVVLDCPEAWLDLFWRNEDHTAGERETNYIIGYELMAGSKLYHNGYASMGFSEDGGLEIGLLFDLPEDLSDLALVPVYADGRDCPEEAISLTYENK